MRNSRALILVGLIALAAYAWSRSGRAVTPPAATPSPPVGGPVPMPPSTGSWPAPWPGRFFGLAPTTTPEQSGYWTRDSGGGWTFNPTPAGFPPQPLY